MYCLLPLRKNLHRKGKRDLNVDQNLPFTCSIVLICGTMLPPVTENNGNGNNNNNIEFSP